MISLEETLITHDTTTYFRQKNQTKLEAWKSSRIFDISVIKTLYLVENETDMAQIYH